MAAPASVRADLSELWLLAWPVVISRVGIMTMGLTDALVVGRYSAVQLGFHALGWAPTAVVVTVAIGLLSGVQVMASRAIGEGEPRKAGAALRRGLAYGLWIGLVSAAFVAVAGPPFLHEIGLARSLADGASRVLVIFALSLPAFTTSFTAATWLEGLGRPKPAMTMMWLANAVNLVVDLVLVPGHLGLPALGAVGGGWATFSSRAVLTLATLIYIVRMPDARALGVFDKPARDRPAERDQRRIGYGAGASNLFEVASFAGMNIIAGWISAFTVAAYAIQNNVVSLVFMVPLGFSTATSVLVGRAHGARDLRALNRASVVGFMVVIVFGLVMALIIWPGAGLIARAYTHEATTVAMATVTLTLSCLFLVPDGLQVVVAQSLRARGDVLAPTATHFFSYAVLMAPLAWYLAIPRHMGLPGIIWAIILASYLSASLLLARFWMLSKRL
ncbi:MAG TPA: MATE family efflux transporter [Caulobacteraceae bacterium]